MTVIEAAAVRAPATAGRDQGGHRRRIRAPAAIMSGSRTASWAINTAARNTRVPRLVIAPVRPYRDRRVPVTISARRTVLIGHLAPGWRRPTWSAGRRDGWGR